MAKKAKSVKEQTLEQKLWGAAEKLRGNLDAAEYKSVVLGLVFLKYINDSFKAKYEELTSDPYGDPEDADEYIGDNIFFVPKESRWKLIADSALTAEIGIVIDKAMEAIEKDNAHLKGILPKNYARPELDKRRLGEVVDIFDNTVFDVSQARDVLGRVYEYFLGEFAREEGKKGGEFYTPECVVRTLVEVLQPYEGKIFDPACGSGGMFVQSAKFIERHSGNMNNISVFGQEMNSNTWRLAKMNLAIRGIEANFGETWADSFHNDQHPFRKFDFVMANPPFNISDWGGDKLKDDPRWVYGIPPEGNANYAWIQHMIYHLNDNGRIGLVLANGSLSSQSGGEGDIRRKLIEADLVEGIVAMPSQLFYNVQIPCCLWFFNKKKTQAGKTLFIDARNLGYMFDRTHRRLSSSTPNPEENEKCQEAERTTNDIARIAEAFEQYREGNLVPEAGFSAVATIEEMAAQDFVLTPGRYVGIAETEDDGEPFEEKMARLTSELSDLFEQSHKLEDEIRKQLGRIGYKI